MDFQRKIVKDVDNDEELSSITKRTIAGWAEKIEWSTAIYA
jgi:hypothetical protein